MRVALAQGNPTVGDVDGNTARVLAAWRRAAAEGADLVVSTELALTGYPPEHLHVIPEDALAEWKDAGQPAIDAWVKAMDDAGFDGQAMVDDARAMLAKAQGR